MDTIKQISAECWAIFKKFAIEMFLAFSNYIERQEKLKRGEPI